MTDDRRSSSVAWLALIAVIGAGPACVGTGGAAGSPQYTSPRGIFSATIPAAPNPFVTQYQTTVLDNRGDDRYDKVMFHVDDFGQFLVAGARVLSAEAIAAMANDEPEVVLRNVSQAALMGWRTDFGDVPEVVHISSIDSSYGRALVTVYRARKGSVLRKAQGRHPTADDAFDTHIANVVARQGAILLFAIAENDMEPDDADTPVRMATKLFKSMRVLTAR